MADYQFVLRWGLLWDWVAFALGLLVVCFGIWIDFVLGMGRRQGNVTEGAWWRGNGKPWDLRRRVGALVPGFYDFNKPII